MKGRKNILNPERHTGGRGRIAVLMCLGMILAVACGQAKEKKAEEKEQARIEKQVALPEVKVTKAQRVPFAMELVSNGKVIACRKAVVNFVVNDIVRKVYAGNGDRVKQGSPLVVVDDYKARQQLTDARLGLEKAALELKSRLMSEGLNELADTVHQELLPRARLATIKLQSGYTAAENSYQKALYDYNNITVYAPFDGVVADMEVKEFNPSSAYKQVCTLIDDSKMEVEFNVLETEIANLRRGMQVEITPYANNQITLTGVVTEVNPRIDENGMVKVKAVADNRNVALVDGMNVSMLVKRIIGDKLVVPKTAVLPRQGKKVVFVHREGKALWKYVTTGMENSREVCIEKGLKPGEEVIWDNNLGLSHESEVVVKD